MADCKNATTLAFAGLNPDAARVGLVVPDFTEQGIGLLIELVESPFLARRCTHTACITEGVDEEGVLTDRAQVDDQREFLCPRGIELDELRLGQVEEVIDDEEQALRGLVRLAEMLTSVSIEL